MNVKVSFQTLHLPPPFAYAYTIDLGFEGNTLHVSFELEYLNREELTEEEIQAEGFDLEDSYSWKGELGQSWVDALKVDLQNTHLLDASDEDPFWLYIHFNEGKKGIPEKLDDWEFRFQELIQAIYEKAGKEYPLNMKIVERKGGKSSFYEVTGSFAERKCTVNKKDITWDQLQELMSLVYSLDFEDVKPAEKPSKDDLWIDPDGLSGYFPLVEMKNGKQISKHILEIIT